MSEFLTEHIFHLENTLGPLCALYLAVKTGYVSLIRLLACYIQLSSVAAL